MDKVRQVLEAARRLGNAVAREDWDGVSAADRELAAILARLPHAATSPELGRALAEAAALHASARTQCESALAKTGQRLDELRANREAWVAYSMDGEDSEDSR